MLLFDCTKNSMLLFFFFLLERFVDRGSSWGQSKTSLQGL
jgi:hypothetical protein